MAEEVRVQSGVGLGVKIFFGLMLGSFLCFGGTCVACVGAPALLGGVSEGWTANRKRVAEKELAEARHRKWLTLHAEPMQLKADRVNYINRMQGRGVIQSIEPSPTETTILVGAAFHRLPVEEKTEVVDAVFTDAWLRQETAATAVILDAKTKRRIGLYSDLGLKLE